MSELTKEEHQVLRAAVWDSAEVVADGRVSADLYLQLADAMGYESGKDGIQFSPEEWAAALLKDALRYRWLRHGDNDEKVLMTYDTSIGKSRPFDPRFDGGWLPRNEKLDTAIDAALSPSISEPSCVNKEKV